MVDEFDIWTLAMAATLLQWEGDRVRLGSLCVLVWYTIMRVVNSFSAEHA